MERRKAEEAKVVSGRAQKALKAGPHGSQIHADGSTQASANQHRPTSGGDGNAVTQFGESYRIGQHSIPHLEKKDLPPAPKGPAAINLDSDYANPKGPTTTRVEPSRYRTANAPSAGGNVRAPKDSANCDDSLGNAGRHHGEHQQAEVQSGRGPAAARRQLGRNWMNGTPDQDGKRTDKFQGSAKVRR